MDGSDLAWCVGLFVLGSLGMVENASHVCNRTYSRLLKKKYDPLELTKSPPAYAKWPRAGCRVVKSVVWGLARFRSMALVNEVEGTGAAAE